MKLPRGSL